MTAALNKLIFILRHSRKLSTVYRLIRETKKYSRLYESGQVDNQAREAQRYLLHHGGKEFTAFMRTSNGDLRMFYEIFFEQQYKLPDGFHARVNTIIDLGANIGLATIWFNILFPQARIISVEMSAANYGVLLKNTQHNPLITPVHAAIHTEDAWLQYDEAPLAYNTHLSKGPATSKVQGFSVSTLMREYKINQVSLMKIDIEGAEASLLSENNSWLAIVEHLIIELHGNYDINQLRNDLLPFHFEVLQPPTAGLNMIFARKRSPK